MAGARASTRYAKALLSLALDQNRAELVNSDMELISNTVRQNKELNEILNNPVIRSSIKKTTLLNIFKDLKNETLNLINALITNKRLFLLPTVANSFIKLYETYKGNETATVTTAIALTDDLKAKVLSKVKELTGKDAAINNIIDDSILGGFILRVGDVQYDASIANQLNKLKKEFTLN